MKKTKKTVLLVAVIMLMAVCFAFGASAINNDVETAVPVALGENLVITFETKEWDDENDQMRWYSFTPDATKYYEFNIENPYYGDSENDTYICLYDSLSSALDDDYMIYEDIEDDTNNIKLNVKLNKNQKYYIYIEVCSCLGIENTHTMTFSVTEGVQPPRSAETINNEETVKVYLNEENYEHSIKFVPTETKFYEFFAECTEISNIELVIVDNIGEYIEMSTLNSYTNECSVSSKLKKNNVYYLEICYYGSSANYVDISIKADTHKHVFSEANEYIFEASSYYDGYIENTCTKCEETVETTIPKVVFKLSDEEFTYNGKTQVPVLTVTDSTGKKFIEGTDYTVVYPKSSINADNYYITITMDTEHYDVDDEVYYIIREKSIENLTVKVSNTKVPYGEYPTVKISGLKSGKDFECDMWYWSFGEQSATVYGIGNYTGKKDITFTVVPAKVSGLKVSKTSSSSITLSWKADKYYSAQYYQIYDVKKKKIIKTISSDNLSYTIKSLKSGAAYSYKVRAYSKENGEKYYGEWVTVTGITKPVATSFTSLKSSKSKTLTAKWDKQTSATGYQIQYSTSSKFSSYKTVKVSKNSSTSKTVSGLKSGKKYYVRIRTYKTIKIDGKSKTVYSSWAKAKSVKIK